MSVQHHLKDLALSDTGFVFDPFSGATFTVNATGLSILHALRDGLSRDQICARLEEQFESQGVGLAQDLEEFVELLRQHEIVPGDFKI